MGACSLCGAVLLPPVEVAGRLGVSVGRVRAILARDPGRLAAFRIGSGWAVPVVSVETFERGTSGGPGGVCLPVCPGCGVQLLSVAGVAVGLGVSVGRVYAVLAAVGGADRLGAFRLGRRWVFPASRVAAYRSEQGHGSDLVLAGVVDLGDLPPCTCGAYSFPHRRGSGACRLPQKLVWAVGLAGLQLAWSDG